MFDVLWERLEKQISRLTTLNPGWQAGASEAEIQEAQQRLGIILPEDYARLVRRHNGQSDAFGVSILSAGGRLAPLEEIVRQHEEMLEWQSDEFFEELDDRRRIRGVIHHAQRVDIGGSIHFDGDNTVLDYIPGPEGVPGQVLAKISECEYTVIGHSFTDYLQRVVVGLEQGLLTFTSTDTAAMLDVAHKTEPWQRCEPVLRQLAPRLQ